MSKFAGHAIERGERLYLQTGGGVGWDDPYERPAEAVLSDVVGGYVSIERAAADYGVVIRIEDGSARIDDEAAGRMRARPLVAAK